MHCTKLYKVFGVLALVCIITLSEVVNAGSTNTDISAADSDVQGTADLPLPTNSGASETEDPTLDTSDDSSDTENVNDMESANQSSEDDDDSGNDNDPDTTTSSNDMQESTALTSSDLPQATENPDDSIAENYHLAAGVPLWADLQLEDTETKTDTSDVEATATDEASATATDGYDIHPRNLMPRFKEYELHCGGKAMGHFMRTCGDAPPITGYLCEATCYCTRNGCIKCRDQGLGICSLSVMEATCRVPNVSFACACRLKGTDRTDALAVMCNNPQ